MVGVTSAVTVWPAGVEPLAPAPYGGRGRPAVRSRRAAGHEPLSVEALAFALPDDAFETVTWREGTNEPLASRFAARRVRPAGGKTGKAGLQPEEWLLVEWPEGGIEPRKYSLSSLPADTPLADLVAAAHQRWRIERDYQELKQDFGLGHYEGRGWRGFHHHASLSIAAYGFLMAERLAAASASASDGIKKNFLASSLPALPADHIPRGRPARPAPRPRLDQEPAPAAEP